MTLLVDEIKNVTSAVSNLTLDTSGNVTAGANLTVTGSATLPTIAGNPTLSGNPSFTGNPTFSNVPSFPSSLAMRNRIINGAMQIWQRGTTGTTGYVADRWAVTAGTSVTATQSSDVPTGYKYSLSLAGTNLPQTYQRIEGINCTDLSGQSITLSFWAKQSVGAGAGSLAVSLAAPTATDNYASTTAIGSSVFTGAATWTQYSVTFASVNSAIANGLQIIIYATATGAATFLVTGVQLEVGSVATPFERRLYGQELALCQRYYEKSYNNSVAVPTAVTAGTGQLFVNAIASGATVNTVNFAVSKRASPTVVSYDNAGTSGKNSYYTTGWNNGGTATINTALEKGFNLTLGGTGTLVYFNADWAASAEL